MRALAAIVVAGALFASPAAQATDIPPHFDILVCSPGTYCDTLCKTADTCVDAPTVCVADWCKKVAICIGITGSGVNPACVGPDDFPPG